MFDMQLQSASAQGMGGLKWSLWKNKLIFVDGVRSGNQDQWHIIFAIPWVTSFKIRRPIWITYVLNKDNSERKEERIGVK